jgi:hypothetical protein
MATIDSKKDAKQALFAVAGVADLAVATIRHLPEEAEKLRTRFPGEAMRAYGNLVQRGEALVNTIRKSRSTEQAVQATRIAVSRTRAARTRAGADARSTRSAARSASTTVRRATEADVKAAKEATEKVGEK